jgi:hypothetical protein
LCEKRSKFESLKHIAIEVECAPDSMLSRPICFRFFLSVIVIHLFVFIIFIYPPQERHHQLKHGYATVYKGHKILNQHDTPSTPPPPAEMDLSLDNVKLTTDEVCVRKFLVEYYKTCQTTFGKSIDIPSINSSSTDYVSPLCPCVPSTLVGIMTTNHTMNVSDVDNVELPGVVEGHWKPSSCVARQRLAIVVPYRDREPHLRQFLSYFHPMLQRQQLDYTIYVAEQLKPEIFNKAMLMNSGFKVVRQLDPNVECLIFHDVDMIPLDDRNLFTCSPTPRHVAAYIDKWGFRPFYGKMFGGSVAFRPHHFELVNGYSNTFYGWGGEDDDMYQRIRAKNLVLHERFPQCVGKYRTFKHARDKSNPSLGMGHLGWQYRPQDYRVNGLNSLKFKLVHVDKRPLYIRLVINLPEPPSEILAKFRARLNASEMTTTRPRPSISNEHQQTVSSMT